MMKQGEIWYANLSPTKGREQAGMRPVVILSGNLVNSLLDVVICCPLTTKVKGYKGNVVLQPDKTNNLATKSEILIFHIRSVSKERLTKRVGSITKLELEKLKMGLEDILRF